MAKTIGIIGIKGGVGKTTIAAALATSLAAHYQKKVLLLDANFHAPTLNYHMDVLDPEKTIQEVIDNKTRISATVHKKFGVDVVPGSDTHENQKNPLVLKHKIRKLENKYDFIILDGSSNPNEELLATLIASDALFIVTTPDAQSITTALKTKKMVLHRSRPIAGLIINKTRDPGYELSLKEIEKITGLPVVASIPDDKNALRAAYTRIPIPIYKRNSKFAKEINRVTSAILLQPEYKPLWQRLVSLNLNKQQVNRELMREDLYQRLFA